MRNGFLSGFTLIELLVALGILMITSLWAMPNMYEFIHGMRQDAQLRQLYRLATMTREQALNSGRTVTLCGSNNGVDCTNEWVDPHVLIFVDEDGNYRLDEGESIVRDVELSASRWKWSASGGRSVLRFRNTGAPSEFGRLTLCPSGESQASVVQLVINRVGRMYPASRPVSELDSDHYCHS